MTIGTRQFEAFYRAGNPSASGHLICFLVSHVCIIIRITVTGMLSVFINCLGRNNLSLYRDNQHIREED